MSNDDTAAAREGELTDDMPPNVTPLHGRERTQQDHTERPSDEPKKTAKEREAERKRAEMEQRAALIKRRASAQQEEGAQGAEDDTAQGRTTVITRYELTDLGNADRLEHHFGHMLRYIAPWKGWIWHDGVRWRRDTTDRITDCAEQTVRKILDEVQTAQDPMDVIAIAKHYERSQTSGKISAMIKLAQHKLALETEDLIASAGYLVTGSGIVDLQTGALCPPETEDYSLNWTPVPYDPAATCPRWERFVSEVMGDDAEMVTFLQRVAGYAAIGHSREQVLLIFSGTGNNGKGVFLRVLKRALGGYALDAPTDFLHSRRYHGHPTDIDQLRGMRLVIAAELAAGEALDEARVKVLTGGDPLRARGIGKDFTGFEQTFTIILQTNHLPVVNSQDDGMWRRLIVVPWRQQWALPGREHIMPGLPVADMMLEETLKGELPGILRWVVEGAKAWFAQGLALPKEVKDASLEYRKEHDSLTPFTLSCIVPLPGARTSVTTVYQAYCAFQESLNEAALTQGEFGSRMKRRYKVKHTEGGNVYMDIALKALKDE